MSKRILVTGTTGTVGSAVVRALQKSAIPFSAAVRDVEKAKQKFGTDIDYVRFDFADPATFEKATENIDRVFLIGPPLDIHVDTLLTPFIDFLKKKNILRVAYLSAFKMEAVGQYLPFHQNVVAKLKKDGFDLTVLRPTFFAQNFKNYEGENISKHKMIYAPAGEGKVAFVDIRDVAEVVVKVLTEGGHSGKEYDLTGPESMSYADAAKIISEALQESIQYAKPSPDEFTQTLKNAGAPDFIAPYMNHVYALVRDGHVNVVSADMEKLLKRKPTALKKVVEDIFNVQHA